MLRHVTKRPSFVTKLTLKISLKILEILEKISEHCLEILVSSLNYIKQSATTCNKTAKFCNKIDLKIILKNFQNSKISFRTLSRDSGDKVDLHVTMCYDM